MDDYSEIMETVGEFIDAELKSKEMVEKALRIASIAHLHQLRDEGTPYIEHPVRVASRFETDDILQVISLLHDVLEDSDFTYEDLEKEFGRFVADRVQILTKPKGYDMNSYMEHIANDYYCLQVKLSDRIDNIKSLKSCPNIEKRKKYILETEKYFLKSKKIQEIDSILIKDMMIELEHELNQISSS